VLGENIAQAYTFVASGGVEGGFVAAAQLARRDPPPPGCRWPVPESLHHPLRQRLVLLKRGEGNEAAIAFFDFLTGEEAREVIRHSGYDLP